MKNCDSDQFSDDDSFKALTEEAFDLLQLTEEERAELVAVVNWEGNEESGDELDDENLPLFYTRPIFQWASGNYVPPEPSTRTKSALMASERLWIIFSCFIQTQF